MKGTVKFFSNRKGYGFITGEDGNDYFVHHTGINAEGYKTLKSEQNVEFDVNETERGNTAVNVTAI